MPQSQHYISKLEDPIFVIGYMHSGTTLLMNVLKNHSKVFGPDIETKYFDHLPDIRAQYPNLTDPSTLSALIRRVATVITEGYFAESTPDESILDDDDIDELIAQVTTHRTYGAVFHAVYDYFARQAGKTRWLEKTPAHTYHIDVILTHIPQARFVNIVRDPRDVLASKRRRKQGIWSDPRYTSEQRALKNLERAYDPLWDALSWKSAVRAVNTASKEYPDHVLSIRYEDLTATPEPTIRDLCTFLSMDFEQSMLNIPITNTAEGQQVPTRGFSTRSIGRWKDSLPEGEVVLIQTALKREMQALSYQPASIGWMAKSRIPLLLVRSGADLFARLARRWRRWGFWNVRLTLINYIKRILHLIKS